MRALGIAVVVASIMLSPGVRADDGARDLQRIAQFIAGAPVSAADSARITEAWTKFRAADDGWKKRATEFRALADRLEAPTTPYERTLKRDKATAIAFCPVAESHSERPLQRAIAAAVERRVTVVAQSCEGGTPYVVTRADVAAFLAEQRFFAAHTGLQESAWNDGRSVDAWAHDLAAAFPTAPVLGRERLAYSESRWLLTRTVWDGVDDAGRQQMRTIVKTGAGGDGNLGQGVLALHSALILGGTRAGLDRQVREFMAAAGLAMSGQAVSGTALQELRSWGQ